MTRQELLHAIFAVTLSAALIISIRDPLWVIASAMACGFATVAFADHIARR